MLKMYCRYAAMNGLKNEILYAEYGKASLAISGLHCFELFKHESGKHVVQRCPPTENRGRRHTSVISVAVLPLEPESKFVLSDKDIEVETKRGTGPGGQHKNKTESCVRMKHKPTGITVKVDSRDQHANKKECRRVLESRVRDHIQNDKHDKHATAKRSQMGGGGRSNKIRTYNFIENRVTDHIRETKTTQIDKVMKGDIGLLM